MSITSLISLFVPATTAAQAEAKKKKVDDATADEQKVIKENTDSFNLETQDTDFVVLDKDKKELKANEERFTVLEGIKKALSNFDGLVEKLGVDKFIELQKKVAARVSGDINKLTAEMKKDILIPDEAPKAGPGSQKEPLKPEKKDFLIGEKDEVGQKYGRDENLVTVVNNDGKADPDIRFIPTGIRNSAGYPEILRTEKGINRKKAEYVYYVNPFNKQTQIGIYVELEEKDGAVNKFVVSEGGRYKMLIIENSGGEKDDDKALFTPKKFSVIDTLKNKK